MPVYAIVIVNAVLAVLVVGAVAGVQLWSILTQHRDAECEGVRLRRPRLRISIGFDKPRSVPSSRLAREDTSRIPDEILLG